MNKLAIEVTANIPSAAQIEPISAGMHSDAELENVKKNFFLFRFV